MELVLNTYGTSLSKDSEGFVISSDGKSRRVPSDGIKSIRMEKGTLITSDAIVYAIANEIEVLFMERGGKPAGRVWSPKYGSISTIRKGQLAFSISPEATKLIVSTLDKKISGQQALLMMLSEDKDTIRRSTLAAVSRMETSRQKIMEVADHPIDEIASFLRGWEGAASKIYFDAYNQFLPEPVRFENRSQHPATDMANAFLNYGYGILYGKVEGALIKSGIDPYIGIFHRDEYNRPVLAYDMIEPYRVWVDYVVYRILNQGLCEEDVCSRHDNGSVWLENLGRRIIIQSMNDYLSEVVEDNRIARSRATRIELDTQKLAQKFKQYE